MPQNCLPPGGRRRGGHARQKMAAAVATLCTLSALTTDTRADIVVVHDDSFDFVGRMSGGDASVNDTSWWSVHASGSSSSAQQSFASVAAAVPAALPAPGAGKAIRINSATLTFAGHVFGSAGESVHVCSSTAAFTAARTPSTSDGTTPWPGGAEPGTSASFSGPSAYLTRVATFSTGASAGADVTAIVDGLLNAGGNGRIFVTSSPAAVGGSVSSVQNASWGTGSHWPVGSDNVHLTIDYDIVDTVPQIGFFTASDGTVTGSTIAASANTDVTLAWAVTGATTVSISPGPGAVGASGTAVVTFNGSPSTTYTLTATNAQGSSVASVTVIDTATVVPPSVTEFLANPDASTSADEDGDREDWVEITNPNAFAIGLGGYYLTDDPLDLTRWQVPAGTDLDAGGILVLFASGKDRSLPASELHTDFKLDADGDHLALVAPDGTTVLSSFTWTAAAGHPAGVSYGVDGSPPAEHFYLQPSPGAANSPPYFLAGKVLFSEPSKTFTSSFQVTLSSQVPGMQIRYTTDRSEPTSTSALYGGPLTISSSTMLRARLIDPADGSIQGDVSARNYLKLSAAAISPGAQAGAANLAGFTSNLPIIVVDNFGGSPASTGSLRTTTVTAFEPVGGVTSMTDAPAVSTRAGYRIRGASSAGFAKKQYRVELRNQEDEDKSEPLLGLPSDADWVLGAPYVDKALIRNTLTFELGRAIGLEAPRTRFVEVFVNENGGDLNYDTDYKGVYFLAEKIKISDDRVDVARLDPADSAEQEITGGYIARQEWGASSSAGRLPGTGHTELVDPDPQTQATATQKQWIANYLQAFDSALDGPNFKDPVLGYAPYIDLDSFVNLFVINELTRDQDAYMRSNYFHKDRGGPLVQGPLWDYNLTMGTGCCRNNTNATPTGGDSGWQYIENNGVNEWRWEVRLDDDEDFWQAFIDRWQELRRDTLSDAGLHARIDAHVVGLPAPAVRNFAEWNILGNANPGFPSPVTATWEGQITFIKNWASQRMAWIDSQFTAPPTVTPAGGVVAGGTTVTVGGGAGTVYYMTDGSDPRLPGGAVRSGALTAPTATINATTTVVARSLLAGEWSGPVSRTYIVGTAASSANLAVSEIHYHPANPTPAEQAAGFLDDGDFEFVELQNISAGTIDLTGVRFGAGIDFAFADNTVLSPGGRILVVRNQAAFAMRYPGVSAADIAGEFGNNTQLANGGETITLLAHDGAGIRNFAYDDRSPWPEGPDGGGPSLVLMRRVPNPDHSLPANWRASAASGGNPAATDTQVFTGVPTADDDGDTLPALVEHGIGSSDASASSGTGLIQVARAPFDVGGQIGDYLTVSFQRNLLAEDVELFVEVSVDLVSWQSGAAFAVLVSEVHIDGGRSLVTYRSAGPVAASERIFVRVGGRVSP